MNVRGALQVILASFVVMTQTMTLRPTAQAPPAVETDVACNEPALPDTFLSSTDIIMLRVSVTGADHRQLAGLSRDDFMVWDDGRPQTIRFFSDNEVPVTVGLIVDASAGLASAQTELAAAGLALAHESRGEDEFFAIEFTDTVRDLMSPDSPFTHQPGILNDAPLQTRARGRTLYDAVAHGLDHAARGRLDQRALIVISGGRDTASALTFAELLERVAASPTVVYAIGMFAADDSPADQEPLTRLASLSGGDAFFPKEAAELQSIVERIARDMRTSYTIGYAPASVNDTIGFHQVEVRLSDAYRGARLRHRDGYRVGTIGRDSE
jgi:Ca-activated chloride channel family protein